MTSELGSAQIPIRATLDKLDKDLDEARSKVDSKLGTIAKSAGKLVGGAVLGGIGLVIGGFTAIGAAAHGAAMEVDDAYDTIRIGTGATGDKLAGLQDSFNTVYGNFPGEAGVVSDVITSLNAKLDVTDDTLEELALPLAEVTRMLGGDAVTNADAFARTLGDWDVPAEKGAELLDKMFLATQKSGIGFDRLSQLMVQFGAPLRNMGFTVEDSIALLSKWEKEGVNTELVMGSLRIASGKFAKAGKPLRQSLLATFETIQNTTDSSEALAIGMEVFGARAGPDMTAAIREGRFAIDDLLVMMGDAEGAIEDASRATEDWPEKFQRAKNKITLAIQPIGDAVMGTIGGAFDALEPMLDGFGPWIEKNIVPGVEKLGSAAGVFFDDIAAGKGPVEGMKDVLWTLLPPGLAADLTGAVEWVQQLVADAKAGDWSAVGASIWAKIVDGFGKTTGWAGGVLDNLRASLGDALGIAPTVDTDMLREGILEPPDVTWGDIGAEIWGRIVAGFGKGLDKGISIGGDLVDSLRKSVGSSLGLEPVVSQELLEKGILVDEVTWGDIGREIAHRILSGLVDISGAIADFTGKLRADAESGEGLADAQATGGAIARWVIEAIDNLFSSDEEGQALIGALLDNIKRAAFNLHDTSAAHGAAIAAGIEAGMTKEIESQAQIDKMTESWRRAIARSNPIGAVIEGWREMESWVESRQLGPLGQKLDPYLPWGRTLEGNARGTDFWRGGPTWVGEEGPEIVDVPQGAAIYSNDESGTLAGGTTYNLVQNFYGPTNARDAEIGVLNGLRALGVPVGV